MEYLVLSDMIDHVGAGFVSMASIKNFGRGVKFENGPLTFVETRALVEVLGNSSEFRKQFGKRPTLVSGSHLFCEVRQHLFSGCSAGKLEQLFAEFTRELVDKPAFPWAVRVKRQKEKSDLIDSLVHIAFCP